MINRFSILFFIFQIIYANDFAQSTLVSGEVTNHNLYPEMAVTDSGKIYIVWVNTQGGGDIHFTMSIDHGQTFTNFSTVNQVENHAITIGFSGPQIEVWRDTIHVIWSDQRNGYDHSTIYYAQSIDQGLTWEEMRIGYPNGVNFYPELLIDSQGILHASFHYYLPGSFAYQYIAHTYSSDGGESWSNFNIVSDYESGEPCDCCPVELHEMPDGKIINGFRNNENNIRDMFSMDWHPEDSSWINLSPMSYDDYFVTYCPTSGPSLVSRDSTVAMAYMSETNSENRIFLTLSHDLGDTFSVRIPMELTSGVNYHQNHPSAVMTQDGNIHVIWEDSRNFGNILYSVLELGHSFMTGFSTLNDSITSSPEIAPQLASDSDDHLYAVWVDRRSGRQIRFSTTYPLDLSAEEGLIPLDFSLSLPYPNPFNSKTTIRFSVNESVSTGKTSLQIFDIHGRLVALLIDGFVHKGTHEIQWDASTQSSGIYFIALQAQGYTQTVKSIYLK